MKNKLNFLKSGLLLTAASLSVCLFGCGSTDAEEKALADFSSEISAFTEYIKDADEQINSLDAADIASIDRLLEILDDMDAEFQRLAELETPSRYQNVESLIDEASENMSLSVSYYHTFFEAEEYSEEYADLAYEYYSRSMKRVKYIGYMLAGGEIPEEEDVTIYEETDDSSILQKWLFDEEENESNASGETDASDTD